LCLFFWAHPFVVESPRTGTYASPANEQLATADRFCTAWLAISKRLCIDKSENYVDPVNLMTILGQQRAEHPFWGIFCEPEFG
jgi:hypothetical protein